MSQRRILLLVTDLEIGGTPTVVRELALRLRGETIHVHVASLKTIGPNGKRLVEQGLPVSAFKAKRAFMLPLVARRLKKLIQRERIDTVLSFLVHANVVAALVARKLGGGAKGAGEQGGVRFFQSIQTTQPKPAWHWRAQGWVAKYAERIIVPSTSIGAVGVMRSGIQVEKFVVIPNAVDPDAFPRSPIPLASPLPVPYPVGFIGRLDPIKRLPDLLVAAGAVGPRITLEIYGEGPDRKRLGRWIEAASNVSITLHGSIARPHDALKDLGLLVLPSEAEGFGLVLIEAMSAGVPVIATNAPGIRDVVEHEKNGLLVPVNDPSALASAIERVIADAELRAKLIEAGFATVRERYIWERVIPAYRDILGLERE